jgi:hypothetical protein
MIARTVSASEAVKEIKDSAAAACARARIGADKGSTADAHSTLPSR